MEIKLKIPEKKILIKIAAITGAIFIVLGLWGPRLVLFLQTRFIPFSSGWEAVYLDNGEVYIGKIRSWSSNTVKLNNAYLLNVVKSEETKSAGGKFSVTGGAGNNVSLVKWGFYQPLKSKGELFISRSGILFWEKLDKDSEAVKQLDTNINE